MGFLSPLLPTLLLANHKHFLRAGGCTVPKPHEDAALSTSAFCFLEVFALESFSSLLNFLFPHGVWLATNNACMLLLCRSSWNLPKCKGKKLYINSESHPLTGNLHFYLEDFYFILKIFLMKVQFLSFYGNSSAWCACIIS